MMLSLSASSSLLTQRIPDMSTTAAAAGLTEKIAYQPLHHSVRDTLDPEYVCIHDQYLQYVQPINELPWHTSLRTRGLPFVGATPVREVASTIDYNIGRFGLRVYTPKGKKPAGGWPSMIWIHGGGWMTGSSASDSSFCTQLCQDASCVVISVDYSLAPEHVFPAAIDDCIHSLIWIVENGPQKFSINIKRLGVAGLSAGGGLAASVVLAASQLTPPVKITCQLLIVPVIDNTASTQTGGLWSTKPYAPYLSATRMMWFREAYMPNKDDWVNWKASPNFADDSLFSQLRNTPTFIVVADHDVLCEEGIAYVQLLKQKEVPVQLYTVKGATHSILLLDAVMESSRYMREAAVDFIRKHLHA